MFKGFVMVLKQVLSMMVGSTCFFVGRDASGGKRGAGVTVMGQSAQGGLCFCDFGRRLDVLRNLPDTQ